MRYKDILRGNVSAADARADLCKRVKDFAYLSKKHFDSPECFSDYTAKAVRGRIYGICARLEYLGIISKTFEDYLYEHLDRISDKYGISYDRL